jgi:hypothetical protein
MAATCTAQMLVGGSMNYWGGPGIGIGPGRIMYLVEGARAAWILEAVAHASEDRPPVTWIPCRPERILADGLVMVAALIDEDPTVRSLIEDRLKPNQRDKLLGSDWADLGELPEDVVEELESAALTGVRSKLAIALLSGSSLAGQIALLERCGMDAEVCTVSWMRQTSSEGDTEVAGKLPPDDPEAHRFYAIRS